MRVLFAGTPTAALPTLGALQNSGHEILGVVTRPDAVAGRGRKLSPSPVAAAAEEAGLPVAKPADTPGLAELVKDWAPDIAVVVAYGRLLPPSILDLVPHGWINLHFSLLPRWRGASPVQHAILAADEVTGITTFRLVKELDAGPVFRQASLPVSGQTSGELLARLADLGAGEMTVTLDEIQRGAEPVAQGPWDGSYAAKITPADVGIDWSAPAVDIDRLVRSANPVPMAWSTWRGERLRILRVCPAATADLAPGRLRVTKKAVWVGTGAGDLQLDLVQAAGKKPMPGADWVRGLRLSSGEEACLG